MIVKVLEMAKNLKAINDGLPNLIREVVKANENIIVEYVSEDQLFEEGKDGNGLLLSDSLPYAPYTVSIKRAKGQPIDRVTLRDTEDFHRSFYLEYGSDYVEVKASDWKYRLLASDYGEEILKVAEENVHDLLMFYVLPFIVNKLRSI